MRRLLFPTEIELPSGSFFVLTCWKIRLPTSPVFMWPFFWLLVQRKIALSQLKCDKIAHYCVCEHRLGSPENDNVTAIMRFWEVVLRDADTQSPFSCYELIA